jgi:hypothetical protein
MTLATRPVDRLHGFTLIDTVFAAALVGVFFVTLFGVNSQCLYVVNSSRELSTAGQALQGRMEQVRNCHWSQITDPNYLSNSVFNTAMNGVSNLGAVTEVATINAYPTALNPAIQLTRNSNGTVTINSTNSAIANGDMVSVTLQVSWTAGPGARNRSVAITTTWAENSR